ncbi:hypothetical protein Tco_1383622 [Tanacetum coccineum]
MLAPRSAKALQEKVLLKLYGIRKLLRSSSFGGTLFWIIAELSSLRKAVEIYGSDHVKEFSVLGLHFFFSKALRIWNLWFIVFIIAIEVDRVFRIVLLIIQHIYNQAHQALMAISSSSSSSSPDNEKKVVKERDELKVKIEKGGESSSEISMSVFENRSSDEEISPANDRFSKADGYHDIPPPITGEPSNQE